MKHNTREHLHNILSQNELRRYSRQIIIPYISKKGQKKIKDACVLIAGVGGLGSISAYYLAAAGIGYIRLVDKDFVGEENLNRQIIYWTKDIGKRKVYSAKKKLQELNPYCTVDAIQGEIMDDTILKFCSDCHIIVDATDNIKTRRVLNRASLTLGIPYIFGGVDGFNGMTTTFVPGETPCFECIFSGLSGNKKTIGVIGPIPGIIASIQALEAIKLILGMECTLKGRLFFFSGIDMKIKEIGIEKNLDCPACRSSKRAKAYEEKND
ncbi:MAG TPA: adenylyltransferase [Deltaproteobacteria bacterium]|nr:adenylyltransferase [Deltaproteobacteria bacterium]